MREMWFTFEKINSIMGGESYSCRMKELCSPCDWDNISFEQYYHKYGFDDADVKSVIIEGASCKKIPEKIIEFFPNIESLEIRNTEITELDKETMNKFKQLKRFGSFGNKISVLHGDLFDDFENLECIQVESSTLLFVDPIIIDKLPNIKHIELEGNSKYNIHYTTYAGKLCFTTLDKVKQHLIDQFMKFQYVKDLQDTIDLLSIEDEEEEERVADDEQCVNEQEDLSPYLGLFADIKRVLQDEKSKDLTINIGNQKFRVNKFIMAIRSPFMAKLFQTRPSADKLNFDDIPAKTFKEILKYIYESELPEDTNFMHLYAAASKLQIQALKEYAKADILNDIDGDNAIELFELGHKCDNNDFKVKAYEEIKKKYEMFDFKDEWLADSDGLMKILEGFKKQEEELMKFRMKFERMIKEDREEF